MELPCSGPSSIECSHLDQAQGWQERQVATPRKKDKIE